MPGRPADKPAAPSPSAPLKATVRSLAGLAKVPVDEALLLLQVAGFEVKHATSKLEGQALRNAREALGLRAWGDKEPPARRLPTRELLLKCLRPLREKGKAGRNHTTPIEHVWGHGIPDHQKDEARELVEALITSGHLLEKPSQGRRHVYLSLQGLALLDQAERDELAGEP
ncbi:MAG: hypothetical protein ACOYOB_21605 [Myxococcota bacterium]|jgi:hypothetical protein